MPLRTPFGPKNAPALFQRLMDRVLRQLREVARAFIDDTIVHSRGFEAHLEALCAVFEQLRKYNIKVHPKKIRILFPEIPFLGHLVNPVGLKPQEVKVAAIQRIPYPTSVTALKQLLGIINYYRRFLKGCSVIARPLNNLLKKDVEFPGGAAGGVQDGDRPAESDAVRGAAVGEAGSEPGVRAAHGLECGGVWGDPPAERRSGERAGSGVCEPEQ